METILDIKRRLSKPPFARTDLRATIDSEPDPSFVQFDRLHQLCETDHFRLTAFHFDDWDSTDQDQDHTITLTFESKGCSPVFRYCSIERKERIEVPRSLCPTAQDVLPYLIRVLESDA